MTSVSIGTPPWLHGAQEKEDWIHIASLNAHTETRVVWILDLVMSVSSILLGRCAMHPWSPSLYREAFNPSLQPLLTLCPSQHLCTSSLHLHKLLRSLHVTQKFRWATPHSSNLEVTTLRQYLCILPKPWETTSHCDNWLSLRALSWPQ